MKFIQTNYLPSNIKINIANTRIYGTTCEDTHFMEIIDANRESLDGEYIITNHLYVLMENDCIEDSKNYFASISIHEEQRGDDVSYYPCVVTSESLLGSNAHLLYLIEQVIVNLSSDNSYFSFDREHKDSIRILGNERNIVIRILSLCGIEI